MEKTTPQDLLSILNNEFRAAILVNSFRYNPRRTVRDVMEDMGSLVAELDFEFPERGSFRNHLNNFPDYVLSLEKIPNEIAGKINYYTLEEEGNEWVEVAFLLARTALDLDVNVQKALGLVTGKVNGPYTRAIILEETYNGRNTTNDFKEVLEVKSRTLEEAVWGLEEQGLVEVLKVAFYVKDLKALKSIDVSNKPQLARVVRYLSTHKGQLGYEDILSNCADDKNQETYIRELLMHLYGKEILGRDNDSRFGSLMVRLTDKGKGFYEQYIRRVLNIEQEIHLIREENRKYSDDYSFEQLLRRSIKKYFTSSSYKTRIPAKRLHEQIIKFLFLSTGKVARRRDLLRQFGPDRKYRNVIPHMGQEGVIQVLRDPKHNYTAYRLRPQ